MQDPTSDPSDDDRTRTLFGAGQQSDTDTGRSSATIERGATIGRYLVIEKVGEGGMGIVMRAYDPKLHREIALKRLHRGALDSEGEARLVREAQAMAQLSHGNVATIHDVDRTPDGVVMAMEFLEGQTLSQWLKEGPHPLATVLDRFSQAGRGLAAAHQAGLVHRDFKPGNAIVSPSGHVKVMDFGLARTTNITAGSTEGDASNSRTGGVAIADMPSGDMYSSGVSLDDAITRDGVVLGTPAYMAPEQHRGDDADARSDQYSFCVSLWEALWHKRPFSGSARAIAVHKHQGPPTLPRNSKVPRPIADAVRRGLSAKAADRWPTMDALLSVLAHDPAAKRQRWLSRGAIATVGLGAAAAIVAWPNSTETPCTEADALIEQVWSEDLRTEVDTAFRNTGLNYAEATSERVLPQLDKYRDQWAQMHTEACEATALKRLQSEALLDLRMECLRRRKVDLAATVDVLRTADAKVMRSAITQVQGLPSLDRCADTEALTAAVAPPDKPDTVAAVEEVRDALSAARARAIAGQIERADADAMALIKPAEDIGYEPLLAEVLSQASDLAQMHGDAERGYDLGTRSYELALRSGDDETATTISAGILAIIGARQIRMETADAWASSALSLAHRTDPGGRAEARVLNALGVVAHRRGENSQAVDYFERGLAILEHAAAHQPRMISDNLNHLGAMLDEQGRYTEAEVHFRRALALSIESLGEEHPHTTRPMDNLALCLQSQGRHKEARALHEKTVDLRERGLGPRHPHTALAYNNLGWDDMATHDYDAAVTRFAAALEIFEEVFGGDHPRVAMAAESVALAQLELGNYDKSEALHRRALQIRRAAVGPDHPNVALSLNGLGAVAERRGNLEEAIEFYRQAQEIVDSKGGGMDRILAETLSSLGSALVTAKRYDEARAPLRRAVKLHEGGGIDPVVAARSRFVLARALTGSAQNAGLLSDSSPTLMREAQELARAARSSLEGMDEVAAAELRTELDAWLP